MATTLKHQNDVENKVWKKKKKIGHLSKIKKKKKKKKKTRWPTASGDKIE